MGCEFLGLDYRARFLLDSHSMFSSPTDIKVCFGLARFLQLQQPVTYFLLRSVTFY